MKVLASSQVGAQRIGASRGRTAAPPRTAPRRGVVARSVPRLGGLAPPVGDGAPIRDVRAQFRELQGAINETAEGVRLPLECQQLLGMPAGQTCKDSQINQAYDDLMAAPVEDGFSESAIAGREELLEIARRDLISSKGRTVEQRDITIPYDLVPGAMAVLPELGHNNLALELGLSLLRSEDVDQYPDLKRDVLLSMALAHCNLARDIFESQNQVVIGCKHLEEAMQLLQGAGSPSLAPELVREIKAGLAELNTHYALEQVAMSITPERLEGRKRAVRNIRDLLRQADEASRAGTSGLPGHAGLLLGNRLGLGSRSGQDPQQRSQLAQVVNRDVMDKLVLHLTCEELVHLQEWEAVARSPEGRAWVYPGLLETIAAAHIVTGFVQCQPAYVKMAVTILKTLKPASAEVLVMQGICQVLLGSVERSADLLQQAERVGRAAAAQAGGDDTDVEPAPAGLRMFSTGAYAFVKSNSPPGEDGLLPGLCLLTETWLCKAAFPMFRDTAYAPPSPSLVKYFDDSRVESLITQVYDEQGEGLRDSLDAAFGKIRKTLKNVADAAAAVPQGEVELLDPLLQPRPRIKWQAVLAGVGLIGATVAGGLFYTTPGRRAFHSAAPGISTAMYASADKKLTSSSDIASASATVSAEQFSLRTAEQLLRNWEDAKQAAMGPNFDTDRLTAVLAEPVLAETRQKVANFKSQGWFMRFKLHKILAVELEASSGGQITVLASLDESGSMYSLDGRAADGYRSAYEARYQVVRGKDGVWRIARITVLGQESEAK